MSTTSCSIHRTPRFHIPSYFGSSRAIIATLLPHTSRTAAQPYIARTIRGTHTLRTRIIVVVVVVVVVVDVVVVVVDVVLTSTRIIKCLVTEQAPVLG